MRVSRSACLFALGLLLVSVPARAQLAPTGDHYGGRPSDTGFVWGGVGTGGDYSAAIPLDLPASRHDLPVPLQITSGGHQVGAAGLGFDVGLSYIRRDRTWAHRRPSFRPNVVPAARERVTLALLGRALDLVKHGGRWVSQRGAPDLSAVEGKGGWAVYDSDGRTYQFTSPGSLAGTDLFLLTAITGPGGGRVQLDYDLGAPSLPGGPGMSIDLARVSYNWHPAKRCFKNQVTLDYDPARTAALSYSMLGNTVVARMRVISNVNVLAHGESCGTALERLRRYSLTYQPDADTGLPQLTRVSLFGRQGTAEENVSLPVASYSWGSATTAGKLHYERTQSVALPIGADSTRISATARDGTVSMPGCCEPYATWQSLTDVTGDGRPDLLFAKDGKLWVAPNRPGSSGTTSLTSVPASPLSDPTLTAGAFESRMATNNRFTYGGDDTNQEEVWRQAIDFNGDGRIDIIDAGEQAGAWVVYLNTPGPSPSGVTWVRRVVSIQDVIHHLTWRGLNVQNNFLPLARRFTSRDRQNGACLKSNGTEWVNYAAGWGTAACSTFPQTLLNSGAEETFTEWEITDVNGDGYPDLVFNSSPVGLYPQMPPIRPAGMVLNFALMTKVQPRDGSANKINAMLNIGGARLDFDSKLFSAPIDLESGTADLSTNTQCGIALWVEGGSSQRVVCDLADINGDGLLDRIENDTTARLGTGKGFSPVHITLPGPMSAQLSGQVQTCSAPKPNPPGSTTFAAGQTVGLRDLTGDGIPDYIDGSSGKWTVAIGTGTGFATAIPIDSAVFSISTSTERCDGASSLTQSGLFDLDGDGRPDVVSLNGRSLDTYQLVGALRIARAPEAGRLVKVDNGYGGTTFLSWRSAKEDGDTVHQVPFPEIVVTSTEVSGSAGLGGSLSASKYAFGGASLLFDSTADAFVFAGYQRSIRIDLTSQLFEKVEGRATITDNYGLDPFSPAPKAERFGRYLRVGRIKDVTTLSGNLPTDPWRLLAVDTAIDGRRVAATHFDWTPRLFEEPASTGASAADCLDLMYPYDYANSFGANLGTNGYNVCSAHGFMYQSVTESWRGTAAPPSTANVATRDQVREIDDFGRVRSVLHLKDMARTDDDICVDTQYATPTGSNQRVLSALASRRVWECTKSMVAYSTEQWQYDGLANGAVSNGFVTGHSIDRRSTDTGAVLGTIRAFDASYDVAGNLSTIRTVRDDGVVRLVRGLYDPFGVTMVDGQVSGTGVPTLEMRLTVDPYSLEVLSTTDANRTQRGVVLDGFGRATLHTITQPGGTSGVLWATSYLGFSGSDPLGRRVAEIAFADPVPPRNVGSEPGRTSVEYLDELGRQRRLEISLGGDYAGKTLVTGFRRYDQQGHVAFEADPFLSADDPGHAYGTTYLFNTDGTHSCSIRGYGPQQMTTVTNAAREIFPTCYSRIFEGNTEILSVRDAAAQLSTAPQANVARSVTLTAVGRVLSRSTVRDGARTTRADRLEYQTFDYDRLGNLTALNRYLDPANSAKPVQTSWRFDSLGQMLTLQEPAAPVQTSRYDNWGELVEASWVDGTTTRRMISRFDALGRVIHREEQSNGRTNAATVNDYVFDGGASSTPEVTPTYLLGRLAKASAPTGSVQL